MGSKWYAIYTRARWERKVAEQLIKIDVENYCPLTKVVKQWSDRKKLVEEPLFKSYVFVKVEVRQQSLLRQIDGFVNFVYWLGKPAVIRDEEIDLIKRFLNEHINVRLEKAEVNVHDRIKFLNGPFMEMEARVITVNNRTIKALLPTLGCMMTAEKKNVEVIIEQPVT
jgi:transcription antitermination factor NusG